MTHSILSIFGQHWLHAGRLLKRTALVSLISWLLLNFFFIISSLKGFHLASINVMNGVNLQEGVIIFLIILVSLLIHIVQRKLLQSAGKVSTELSHLIEKSAKNHFNYLFTLLAVLLISLLLFIPVTLPLLLTSPQKLELIISTYTGSLSKVFFYMTATLLLTLPLYGFHRLCPATFLQLIDSRLTPMLAVKASLKLTRSDFHYALIILWIPLIVMHATVYQAMQALPFTADLSSLFCIGLLLPVSLSIVTVHLIWLNTKPMQSFQSCIDSVLQA